ncbi:hypothetical protein ACOME3_008540 [Neoechinorhynchus agilis]
MDVCIIAEIMTESPLFSLADLLNYRNANIRPIKMFKIEDEHLRIMVDKMIERDPTRRPSVQHCIDECSQVLFNSSMIALTYINDLVDNHLTSSEAVKELYNDLVVKGFGDDSTNDDFQCNTVHEFLACDLFS